MDERCSENPEKYLHEKRGELRKGQHCFLLLKFLLIYGLLYFLQVHEPITISLALARFTILCEILSKLMHNILICFVFAGRRRRRRRRRERRRGEGERSLPFSRW